MQTKFKRHELVTILRAPNEDYIEYHDEEESEEKPKIEKGMTGKINILLPNGQYHVEILDKNKKTIAYAPFNEEDLERV